MGEMLHRALHDGRGNHGVDFRPKGDGSGINLRRFEFDGVEMEVVETLEYRPWSFGQVTPGAGQIGVYRLRNPDGQESFALVKDYSKAGGNLVICLLLLEPTEQDIKHRLKEDHEYGSVLRDYLFD